MMRTLLDAWHAHQAACALLIGLMVLAIAWVRVLFEYHRAERRRAPLRWYVGYSPPGFEGPGRWDLWELNTLYPRRSGRDEEPPGDRRPAGRE